MVRELLRRFTGVALCCLAVACTRDSEKKPVAGDRPPAETKTVETTPVPADDRPAIVIFGDSLTSGLGVPPEASYPSLLQRKIDAMGKRYRVVNAGVAGDTSGGGLARVGSVLAYKPEIVILELGGNDGLRGLPVDTIRANLDEIIVRLQKGGARVILAGMKIHPNYGPEYTHAFEQVYTDLARKHKIARIPFLLEDVAARADRMQTDWIHPNEAGHRVVAENVMQVLRPLLK